MPDVVRIGTHWWRVAKNRNGDLEYAAEPAPFYPPQVAQSEVNEATTSPEVRVPTSFRDLSGGSGQAEVPKDAESTRYDRIGDAQGEGVDASLTPEGPIILAPSMNVLTTLGAQTTGVFYDTVQKDPTGAIVVLHGSRVAYLTGSTGNLDAGAHGATITSGELVFFRGVSQSRLLYLIPGYTGTPRYANDSLPATITWTDVGNAGGFKAVRSAVVIDGEMVVALTSPAGVGNAAVASMDDGGPTPTIFGVIDPVGDPGIDITRLMVHAGRVVVIKSGEGVFLLANDRRTLSQEVFKELLFTKIFAYGATVWRGVLWLPTENGLYAISSQFGIQNVSPLVTGGGTGLTQENGIVLQKGKVIAVAGDTHNLYAFYQQHAFGPSWLYKANVAVGPGGVEDIAWFELLNAGSSSFASQESRMAAASIASGTTVSLLLWGQTEGATSSLRRVRLATTKDPRADGDYEYAAGGTLYFSRTAARFPAIDKGWYGVVPTAAPINRSQDGITATTALSVRTRYKLGSTAWATTSPYGYTEGASQTTGEGERDAFFLRGRALDTGVRLASTNTGGAAGGSLFTPQVRAVTIEYDLEPEVVWRHSLTLDLTEGSAPAGGVSGGADPLSPTAAIEYLRTLPASGTVVFTDVFGVTRDITMPINGVRLRARGDGQAGLDPNTPGILVSVVLNEQTVQAV